MAATLPANDSYPLSGLDGGGGVEACAGPRRRACLRSRLGDDDGGSACDCPGIDLVGAAALPAGAPDGGSACVGHGLRGAGSAGLPSNDSHPVLIVTHRRGGDACERLSPGFDCERAACRGRCGITVRPGWEDRSLLPPSGVLKAASRF